MVTGEATPFLYVNKLLPGECFTINLNEPGNLNRKNIMKSILMENATTRMKPPGQLPLIKK